MATVVSDLDTPAVVIDLDIVEANIRRAQEKLASHGLQEPPAHQDPQDPALAKMQMDAGAIGITCQKIGEVEVMADAGVADDILLTYNIMGEAKAERLVALIRRLKRMAVVVDNEVVARGLSEAGKRHGVDIRYLIECDTGGSRNGVQTPQAALDLAKSADAPAEHAVRRADDLSDRQAGAAPVARTRDAACQRRRHRDAGRLRRRLADAQGLRRLPDAHRISRRHVHL